MTDGIRQFKINGKQVEFSNDKKSASRDLYAQDAQLNSIFEKLNKADANGNIDDVLDEKEIKDFQQKIIDAAGKDGDLSSEEARSLLDSMGLKDVDANKFFGFIQSMFSKDDTKEVISDAAEEPQESEKVDEEQITRGVIVQNGESPATIAKKFGVSLQDLLDANKDALKGKGDKKYFLVGQEIVIPRKIDDEELATLNAGRKSAEETTGDYAQQAAVREQRAAEARQLRAQEEAELKELGMTERAKGEVKAHYSKTPDKIVTFKKVANAKNGRSICVDKNGNYVIVAKDGTILNTDFVKNPEKYEQARKLNEEVKTRNGAKGIAKEFYQIADDNSGLNSIHKMQKLLDTKVNSKNITQFLDEYDKFKQGDSSIIDTITSEVGASGTIQQKKVLTTLMDKLSQAARQAGVSETEIKKANADFLKAYNAEYTQLSGAFRRTNPKDMEKAMDSLRGNILAKQNGTGDVDSAEAIKQFKDLARNEHNSAVKDFNKAREEEGWTAKVGDTVCGWFGCNTIEDLNKKLGANGEAVKKLINSKTEAEFRANYKEIFGVEFDPNKISARQNAIEKYSFALNCDNTVKAADKVLKHSDSWGYSDIKTAIRNNFKYDNATIDQIIEGYAQSKGIQNPTDADKKTILVQFLNDTKTNARREFTNIAQGKSLDQMGKDIELITRSAFGTNDIVKDVIQFNENQQMTEMVTEAGFEIAGTIALQFVPGLGQMAAARLAVSAARWGTKAVKVVRYAQKAEKVFSTVNKFQKGEAIANATTRTARVVNRGVQIGSQMVNTGVATAGVDLSNGKSVKETTKKALMNMSFAGVGASSSILAPKLMSAFGIADKALATEIAEEIINAAGSYGVTKLEGGEYGKTDAFIDFASGLIISRISHVGGGKSQVKPQGATTPDVPTAQKVETPNTPAPKAKPETTKAEVKPSETPEVVVKSKEEPKAKDIKPETETKVEVLQEPTTSKSINETHEAINKVEKSISSNEIPEQHSKLWDTCKQKIDNFMDELSSSLDNLNIQSLSQKYEIIKNDLKTLVNNVGPATREKLSKMFAGLEHQFFNAMSYSGAGLQYVTSPLFRNKSVRELVTKTAKYRFTHDIDTETMKAIAMRKASSTIDVNPSLVQLCKELKTDMPLKLYRVDRFGPFNFKGCSYDNLGTLMKNASETGNIDEVLNILKSGDISINFKNHMGTSVSKTTNKLVGSRPVEWEINAPAGTEGAYLESLMLTQSSYEGEFLLQAGSTLKITDANYSNGTWHLKADLVQNKINTKTSDLVTPTPKKDVLADDVTPASVKTGDEVPSEEVVTPAPIQPKYTKEFEPAHNDTPVSSEIIDQRLGADNPELKDMGEYYHNLEIKTQQNKFGTSKNPNYYAIKTANTSEDLQAALKFVESLPDYNGLKIPLKLELENKLKAFDNIEIPKTKSTNIENLYKKIETDTVNGNSRFTKDEQLQIKELCVENPTLVEKLLNDTIIDEFGNTVPRFSKGYNVIWAAKAYKENPEIFTELYNLKTTDLNGNQISRFNNDDLWNAFEAYQKNPAYVSKLLHETVDYNGMKLYKYSGYALNEISKKHIPEKNLDLAYTQANKALDGIDIPLSKDSNAKEFLLFLENTSPNAYKQVIDTNITPTLDNAKVFKKDFEKLKKTEAMSDFIKNFPDNPKSDILYNKYLDSEFPSTSEPNLLKIKDKCKEINEKYGTKIILPTDLKEADDCFKLIEKELYNFKSQSNGKAKLPPVIDFLSSKAQFIIFADGFSEIASGAVNIKGMHVDYIKNTLKHEMTHSNDLKNLMEFPNGVKRLQNGQANINEYKYYDDLKNIGLSNDRIDYAYTNPMEFIAVASEGDLSKCSKELKEALIDFGMPEWMLKNMDEPQIINQTQQFGKLGTLEKPNYTAFYSLGNLDELNDALSFIEKLPDNDSMKKILKTQVDKKLQKLDVPKSNNTIYKTFSSREEMISQMQAMGFRPIRQIEEFCYFTDDLGRKISVNTRQVPFKASLPKADWGKDSLFDKMDLTLNNKVKFEDSKTGFTNSKNISSDVSHLDASDIVIEGNFNGYKTVNNLGIDGDLRNILVSAGYPNKSMFSAYNSDKNITIIGLNGVTDHMHRSGLFNILLHGNVSDVHAQGLMAHLESQGLLPRDLGALDSNKINKLIEKVKDETAKYFNSLK